jgi:hypothetical protein
MGLLQLPLSFSYKFFFNAQGPNLIDIILLCQNFPIFDPLSPLLSLDPIKSSPDLKLAPKNLEKKYRKKEWELNQVFQEMWVVKLPWVEVNGKV